MTAPKAAADQPNRIRIVSDGKVHGTRVLMPDGSRIPGVTAVEILPLRAGGDIVQARITFAVVELDVTAELVEVTELADTTQRYAKREPQGDA